MERFIIIDDDAASNLLSKFVIQRLFGKVSITSFIHPVEALSYIASTPPDELVNTVLFVDINMPVLTGWEFLTSLSEQVPMLNFKVYIVSSSIDKNDQILAEDNQWVNGYIEKPLRMDILKKQFLIT